MTTNTAYPAAADAMETAPGGDTSIDGGGGSSSSSSTRTPSTKSSLPRIGRTFGSSLPRISRAFDSKKTKKNGNKGEDALGRMLKKVLTKDPNDPKQSSRAAAASSKTHHSLFASTLRQDQSPIHSGDINNSSNLNERDSASSSSLFSDINSSSSSSSSFSSSLLDVEKLRNALYRRSPNGHGFPIPRPTMETTPPRQDTLPKTTLWLSPPSNKNNNKDIDRKKDAQSPQEQQQPAANDASASSLSSSHDDDWTSSLTDYIRSMKFQYEAESARKMEQNQQQQQQGNSSSLQANSMAYLLEQQPLPKWRLPQRDNRLRDQRKEVKPQPFTLEDWTSSIDSETNDQSYHRNNKSSGSQPIQLPDHDISLTEASLLFREKAKSLRRLLISLGELSPRDFTSEEDIMCSTDLLELMALELGLSGERSDGRAVAQSDQDRLLQRRAASEETHVTETMPHNPYESLPPRPPVVCIMGHVDHGKTTLLDALRNRSLSQPDDKAQNKKDKKKAKKSASGSLHTNVAGTEAGGITQVISAFQVPLVREESKEGKEKDGEVRNTVTFLDTPGHAAFRAMRQSGSDAADIIVLVVAADDGVSKQTVEIIDFYKSIVKGAGSGGVSLVVAMNKIDKPGVDVKESRRKIEMQLLQHGIVTEGMLSSGEGEFGPPVQLVPVSGLKGYGLDDLIDALTLQADVMDLRADHDTAAEGIVMDARVEKGIGIVADCIIRWGKLETGDIVVSGTHWGRVRLLKDTRNNIISKGLPSQPVRVIGFDSVPRAGEPLVVVESEEVAAGLVVRRKALEESDNLSLPVVASEAELQSSGSHMMSYEWKEALEEKHGIDGDDKVSPIRITVVVKADADGSLIAVRDALIALREESKYDIIIDPVKVGVGPLQASDIQIAKEGGASIVCFNVKNDKSITSLAEEQGISLVTHNVIYSLLDDVKTVFAKFLPPRPLEVVHGRAKVKAIYDIGGIDEKVAGLEVTEGTIYRDKAKGTNGAGKCLFRVIRGSKTLPSCESLSASSLKHFKQDVTSVAKGKECGLSLSGHSNYEEGDVIECFSIEMLQEFV